MQNERLKLAIERATLVFVLEIMMCVQKFDCKLMCS